MDNNDDEELSSIEEDLNNSQSVEYPTIDLNNSQSIECPSEDLHSSNSYSRNLSPSPKFVIDCVNCKIIFKSDDHLVEYIESNSSFDGEYYRFPMNKGFYKIMMVMRDVISIADTILKYHITYI